MTIAARLTAAEAAAARLAAQRGPRVSQLLSQGRAQLLAGTLPPVIHDVAQLERDALLPGLRGAMAAAQLRVIRWDRGGLPGTETPARAETAPAAPVDPATGPSDLLARIDRLMRRA